MTLFDEPLTLESLLARIEALEAAVHDKPVRQSTEVPPELREAWSLWTLHKSGSKGWSALAKTKQIAKLAELSGNDPDHARQLVDQAIEHGWQTFYPLRDPPKGKAMQSHKTVKQATTPQESPLERDLAYARYMYGITGDEAERDRVVAAATAKHRMRA